MIRSDLLRQALADNPEVDYWAPEEVKILKVAARFALRVWEGDQQLVERVAVALREYMRSLSPNFATEWEFNIERARAVLAAITEGSGE